jgi:ParB family chromosome partitioning protein
LEEAEAIQSLLSECNLTHNQVAESIGRSRASVTNLLRLLGLTPKVKEMINSGLLEMGHARALLGLTGNQQIEAAELIVKKSLSVRETEKLINRMNDEVGYKQDIFIKPEFKKKASEWGTRLSKQLSSKVNVRFNPEGKGRVVIHFDSVEEAEWMMSHLTVKEIQEIS